MAGEADNGTWCNNSGRAAPTKAAMLRHPYVLRVHAIFLDPEDVCARPSAIRADGESPGKVTTTNFLRIYMSG
eukprot:7851417-Alexandrium_andersonii.AAC.1